MRACFAKMANSKKDHRIVTAAEARQMNLLEHLTVGILPSWI
jgi:hypothetical protein